MKILIFAVFLFSSVGFSKTLIVSDIDDTIKVSHVRDSLDNVSHGLVTTSAFKGMNELYHTVVAEGADIIYVTNATDLLMHESHTTFINRNKFPKGEIFFRKSSSDHHKVETIRKYLKAHPEVDRMILIGDNGERDITFYETIEKEFKNIDTHTYIHILYSHPEDNVLSIKDTQKGFVTPLEILMDLTFNGFISAEKYLLLADKLAKEILEENKKNTFDPQYFPHWLNCRDMMFGDYSGLMSPAVEAAYDKIKFICE